MRRPSTIFVLKATCTLLVFIIFGQVSLFFLCRCGKVMTVDDNNVQARDKQSTQHCYSVQEMEALAAQVIEMRKELREIRTRSMAQNSTMVKLTQRNRELVQLLAGYQRAEKATINQEIPKGKPNIQASAFLKGQRLLSEFEVIPFDSITYNGIYQLGEALSRNPAERPLPRTPKGKDYREVVQFATRSVNEEFEHQDTPTLDFDLYDGIMRIDRQAGSQYDLYFRTNVMNVYHRVRVLRRFEPLQQVGNVETIDTNQETINLVLPLSGHLDKFRIFMSNFADVCIRWDRRVFLTVVFFGQEGKQELNDMLSNLSKKENYTSYKILELDEPFSRGLGLQKGALDWDKGNVLMLFCDVDVHFTPEFLEKCRFHTNPGHQVYYPIVFSLYNPVVVYGGSLPPLNKQFSVNRETGYWRDYGFGMVCQYRSDFITTGGFDLSIKGWGMEDVKLYRKYLESELTVIRAVDRSIFHIYHHKHCSRSLSDKQYINCINSKVKSEASHTQLGLLAFGGKIFSDNDPNWIEQLQSSATSNQQSKSHDGDSNFKKEFTEVPASARPVHTVEAMEALDLKDFDNQAAQGLLNKSGNATSNAKESNK